MSADRETNEASAELELARERTFGGRGVTVDRAIHIIDLSDFDARRDDIDAAIWAAATDSGFFQVAGHGIPRDQVDEAFALSAEFFALSEESKADRARPRRSNSGWESTSQRRPSTGTLDQKESYQITLPQMEPNDLWPTEVELAGFRERMEAFEAANWDLAMRLLGCFARMLGFDEAFFTERHDPSSPEYQSTLRLLHYFPLTPEAAASGLWRAGAHTDYDCLTLLHQRTGQRGLQVCPGAEATLADGEELRWTSVEPSNDLITCNIGDMLMRWSDDRLPSTLHRVTSPGPGDDLSARYSIAFFAQANRDAIIEGPSGVHAPISAADYLQERITANFVPDA